MSGVWDVLTGKSGEQAAQASLQAAQTAAAGQTEALEYLKETEALPQQYREEALTGLAGIYGLPGGDPSMQRGMIERAMESPLYQQMMATIPAGEEAIMRQAAATGGLRSGTTSENLARLTGETQRQALTQSYGQQVQGLTGLAGMPSAAKTISQAIAAPSQTLAQGQIAAAQAQQQQAQSTFGALAGLGGAALMAPTGTFSDIRLKENIEYLGQKNGHAWFSWDWKDNDLGLDGQSHGVMAHLVHETNPEAISTKDGYIAVNYEMLGLTEEAA